MWYSVLVSVVYSQCMVFAQYVKYSSVYAQYVLLLCRMFSVSIVCTVSIMCTMHVMSIVCIACSV